MIKLLDYTETEGKAVKATAMGGNACLIVFTDNTGLLLDAESESCIISSTQWDSLLWQHFDPSELLDLGAITQAEYEAKQAERDKLQREKEQREYERLKAKFATAPPQASERQDG